MTTDKNNIAIAATRNWFASINRSRDFNYSKEMDFPSLTAMVTIRLRSRNGR